MRVQVFQTNRDLSLRLTPRPDLEFGTGAAGARVIRVNDAIGYQYMVGFGGAMTDSAAYLMHDRLSSKTQTALMRSLFSRSGIHLNFVRVPIGASDFTADRTPYSYDEMPADQTDPLLAHFSTAHDNGYVLPTLRDMLRANPRVVILANPWSPPTWMKANHAFDDLGGFGTLLPGTMRPLANYFVKFIQAYALGGVRIDAVTPQNEPGSWARIPALNLSAPEEATFIARFLAPALAAHGLYPQIYGLDRGAALPDALQLLAGPAAPELAGIAWHCYGGDQAMGTLHRLYPGVGQITTECAPGLIPYSVTEALISATRNWASAVALWSIALDPSGGPVQPPNSACPGCTGIVTIDPRTRSVAYKLNYYQLGQLSRFVEPGAVRIESDRFVTEFRDAATGDYGVTPGLDDVAFENRDGTRVLVAYNNSASTQRFAVSWRRGSFRYALAPQATVTFRWRP